MIHELCVKFSYIWNSQVVAIVKKKRIHLENVIILTKIKKELTNFIPMYVFLSYNKLTYFPILIA